MDRMKGINRMGCACGAGRVVKNQAEGRERAMNNVFEYMRADWAFNRREYARGKIDFKLERFLILLLLTLPVFALCWYGALVAIQSGIPRRWLLWVLYGALLLPIIFAAAVARPKEFFLSKAERKARRDLFVRRRRMETRKRMLLVAVRRWPAMARRRAPARENVSG